MLHQLMFELMPDGENTSHKNLPGSTMIPSWYHGVAPFLLETVALRIAYVTLYILYDLYSYIVVCISAYICM